MTRPAFDYHDRGAEQIIGSLRFGIPPSGHLREFTVGRNDEIDRLEATLHQRTADRGRALLVEANYGAGKTHLLRLIREMALEAGFAVALVTVDSFAGVRFNRMDQVAAAVARSIELPNAHGSGAWILFDRFAQSAGSSDPEQAVAYERISADGRWDISDELESPGLWAALRAWIVSEEPETRSLVQDWLSNPWDYDSTPGVLYEGLVKGLLPAIRDPRSRYDVTRGDVFKLRAAGHNQAWQLLRDLELLSEVCGYRGLVLLFDEFEDVIQNLNNIAHEKAAFVNLLTLFSGKRFTGMTYFAVTPEFASKCRERLASRYVTDFPIDRFNKLDRYRMQPITRPDFADLAVRIRDQHALAYDWPAVEALPDAALEGLVRRLFSRPSADQIRQAIKGVVAELDEQLEG